MVTVDELEELAFLQNVVVELLKAVLEVLAQAADAHLREGTPLLLDPDVFADKTTFVGWQERDFWSRH